MNEDQITLQRIDTIHPRLKDELMMIYEEILATGVRVRFTRVYSTFAEQNKIYQQGRTLPGRIVTNARGGESFHNYRLAVDFCLLHPDGSVSWDRHEDADHDGQNDWMEVVTVFEKYEWIWGGRWKKFPDTPHMQKTFGLTITKCLELSKNGSVDPIKIP